MNSRVASAADDWNVAVRAGMLSRIHVDNGTINRSCARLCQPNEKEARVFFLDMGVLSLPLQLQTKVLSVPMNEVSWHRCIENRIRSVALASGQSMQIEWLRNSEMDVNSGRGTSFSSSDGFL